MGGTSLQQATNAGTRNATETAWSGSGSGCSAWVTKPVWQQDTGCAMRTVADVSAVADPNTGVWVYDSYKTSGFLIFGGTSVAAPIVASMYALAANPTSTNTLAAYPYAQASALNDVTTGTNGTCAVTYLCAAGTGFDGPTGLGTPNNTPAFTAGPVVPTPPSAPQGLSATAANATVTLSWSPPANPGSAPVTSYNVYRGTSPGGEAAGPIATGVTTTSFTDPSLANGTTYSYTVTAVNAVQEGAHSNEASATPQPTSPGAPTLTASTSTTKGVALAWNAPPANGSTILQYVLYRSTSSGRESAYVNVVCNTATCTYNDAGTQNRQTYYYQVAATNAVGTGPRSNEAHARAR